MTSHAQVVVIGGGVVGCSVAYHLTKQGWTDVVLLERRVLACGTTWAAAGLCAQIRATRALTKLAVYGTDLYARLEEETEQATGYETLGTILCAQTKARTQEYERLAAMGRSFGIEMHRISPEETRKMRPLIETRDLEAIFFCPKDGVTNPEDTTQALAKGARMGGARIYENVEGISNKWIRSGKYEIDADWAKECFFQRPRDGKGSHADVGTTCHLVDQHFGGIDGKIGYYHVRASPFNGG